MHGRADIAVTYHVHFHECNNILRGLLENVCSDWASKHKLNLPCLGFCVLRLTEDVATFPPIPAPAAALCVFL